MPATIRLAKFTTNNLSPKRISVVGKLPTPFTKQSLIHLREAFYPNATFTLVCAHCGPAHQRDFLIKVAPPPKKLPLNLFQFGTHFLRHSEKRKAIDWEAGQGTTNERNPSALRYILNLPGSQPLSESLFNRIPNT